MDNIIKDIQNKVLSNYNITLIIEDKLLKGMGCLNKELTTSLFV